MQTKNTRSEFLGLLVFLVGAVLLLTNGFVPRLAAQNTQVDVYEKVAPIGDVLARIMEEYVGEVDVEKVVEGALFGMMSTLDRHSSYIPERALNQMREETQGEIEGIGVSIRPDENDNIIIFDTMPGSPAAEAGFKPFDVIIKVDDIPVEQIWTESLPIAERMSEVVDKIKGPRGTEVKVTVRRAGEGGLPDEELDFTVKRARVAVPSLVETRQLEGGVLYVRIKDFKDTTAADLRKLLQDEMKNGATSLVMDLRWNPGGLLTASQEVCELFLPRRSLVTYTKGRKEADGRANGDDLRLETNRPPVVPPDFPVVILVNEETASSSEIVTGALQFYKRAIIVGEKTFGKGSVQTIIPLLPERKAALRLTTALYYTPADVTINHQGILPDIEVPMSDEEDLLLREQLYQSYKDDPSKINAQNHGSVTSDPVVEVPETPTPEEQALIEQVGTVFGDRASELLTEFRKQSAATKRTTEDSQLRKAVEVLKEDPVWDRLVAKYHRDVRETQTAAQEYKEESPLDRFLGVGRNRNEVPDPGVQHGLPEEAPEEITVP